MSHAEILVTNVAATDDRRLPIDGERLVMHAPVQSCEVCREIDESPPPVAKWVEEANLEPRLSIQCREFGVHPDRIVVIKKQSHPYAARRRAAQGVEEKASGNIAVPDVILDVQCSLGGFSEQIARGESVCAFAQRDDATLPASYMFGDEWLDRPNKGRLCSFA